MDAGGPGGTARVAGQWTYDAYGNVLSADHIHPHAYTRVGHKGLIFDRLDVGVADRGDDGSFKPGQFVGHVSCEFDTPRIVPFARGLYHNRNRVYMPELGRLAQADPNASGQTLLDLPVYHGLGRFAFSLVSEASFNMEMDFDWAMDWSAGDDEHTRLNARWIDQLISSFLNEEVTAFKGVTAGGPISTAFDFGRGGGKALSRAATELHHVIPKFMGGLSKGATVGPSKAAHRIAEGNLHSMLNKLCKYKLGLSPYGRGGSDAIRAKLGRMTPGEVAEFRRAMYDSFKQFDSVHGTRVAAEFRRELVRQRDVLGKVGLFQ